MFSVVIIARNESHIIGKVLEGLAGITDDVVIVDSQSNDGTPDICRRFGAKVVENEWSGYGDAKNKGNHAARYDWILSLDADEVPGEKLKKTLVKADLTSKSSAYRFKRVNFFCGKMIRFGVWGRDKQVRLFNRNYAEWSQDEVHEHLLFKGPVSISRLKGELYHFTADDNRSYREKMRKYAKLSAEKYFRMGRKAGWVKIWLSPIFSLFRNYIFHLGFLDGLPGLQVCMIHARYTHDKYVLLKKLYDQNPASF